MDNERTLSSLKPGEKAYVKQLLSTGSMRRRLLDIGLIDNTLVECVGRSPAGGLSAYLIRGAVIAIRKADSQNILIMDQFGGKSDKVIALAGNPNVGKSTVFNGLTGLHQHTGNWVGKTVENARGYCKTKENDYVIVDIPGTYSLMAHSAEEEVARDFICFGEPDAVVVVCDATCLERNLNLVLQIIETGVQVIVCLNLMDEAKKKGIYIDTNTLSELLGVPVITTVARKKSSLKQLTKTLDSVTNTPQTRSALQVSYEEPIEQAVQELEPAITQLCGNKLNSRWMSLRLLGEEKAFISEIESYLGIPFTKDTKFMTLVSDKRKQLEEKGITGAMWQNKIVEGIMCVAEDICKKTVRCEKAGYHIRDKKIDQFLTSRLTGYPVMALLLAIIFWLTITGANYPSALLSKALFGLQDQLTNLFMYVGAPDWLHDMLVLGVYRVLAWVVSVMLPPMAIFFPLFTLLEDVGYLPRMAYNLDKPFEKCHACGKQCMTMCMGLGCNAAGVTGCRIIDSKRERLIAILTNSFVPCNGRFPTLIAIITMFIIGASGSFQASVLSALTLTGIILFGIFMTFVSSWLLSKTILKGMPSSFTLELPSYRMPQIGSVIVHSMLDRTLFVLGRAITVAAPAGLLIWLMANVDVNGISLLNHCSEFFDPFAKQLGMDGVILMAFILGIPANEIVMPIIIMAYLSQGTIVEMNNLAELKVLLTANGWTWVTAVCTMLFSLMHWPCATTLLTIRKEAGGVKWMVLAFLLPTVMGMVICFLISHVAHWFI